jgi:hypothetical protein
MLGIEFIIPYPIPFVNPEPTTLREGVGVKSGLGFGCKLLRTFSVWRQTHPVTHWIGLIIPYSIPFVNQRAELDA